MYGADAEEIYVEDETFDGDMTGGDLHPTVRSRRARAEGRKRNLASSWFWFRNRNHTSGFEPNPTRLYP